MAKRNRTEESSRVSESERHLYQPSPVLSPTAAALGLQALEEYRSQLWALGDLVETWLAKACNEGGEPPLREWRLMQVLMSLIESKNLDEALRVYMGQHLLPQNNLEEYSSCARS